ncbi:receptor-transporting protein 5 [Carlito syrichta]|uniref:Receptor-transporting protein 5 n=1 Tax=Carlito syrichta TaxID=1868482 RepID=A0A1U7TMK3_CARSF|nr:receptor-transporting protein 5 [Carlito syrichta]
MDRAAAAVWASTFAQLMAARKPRDVWVLLPQDSLAMGHQEGGLQYRLEGLSRLQCSTCPWVWASAHVLVLFHLWWDRDRRRGLVTMRAWIQHCAQCFPPGGDCQMSPVAVRDCLRELVLYILRQCYGDNPSPLWRLRNGSRDRCQACYLGLCFFQRAPDPPLGYMIGSSSAEIGTCPGDSQSPTPYGGPEAQVAGGHGLSSGASLLAASPAVEIPVSEGRVFLVTMVTIRFSPVNMSQEWALRVGSHTTPAGGSLLTGNRRVQVIGKGSLHLSENSVTGPRGRIILVNIGVPCFHGQGPLSSTEAFEFQGLLFRGWGQGPLSFSDGLGITGTRLPPVSYSVGITASGEGILTLPLFLANLLRGQDSLASITEGREGGGGGQGSDPAGINDLSAANADGPTASQKGSVTFPFILVNDKCACADITEGRGKDGGSEGLVTAGNDPLPEPDAGGLVSEDKGSVAPSSLPGDLKDAFKDVTEGNGKEGVGQGLVTVPQAAPLGADVEGSVSITGGSITIPVSVFDVIRRTGPRDVAPGSRGNSSATYGYSRRWLRSRPGRSSSRCRREHDARPGRARRRPPADISEDFLVCICVMCLFWVLCLGGMNPGLLPRMM